jgi:transposase-like protein
MKLETGREDGIIATDGRGRRRLSRERREALLAEFARSGMTVAAFSEWAGISQATFYGWRWARRLAGDEVETQGVSDLVAESEVAEPVVAQESVRTVEKAPAAAFPWCRRW